MKMNWYDLSKYRNQLYGLSMLWIVIFHVWETFSDMLSFEWPIAYIIKDGNYGVDLFLFLSGISMYFAIQKYIDDKGNINVIEFYKKRLSKILKVYGLFCIPFFVIIYLIIKKDVLTFLQQLFFCRDRVSSFWFLLCIAICYLIYPFIYKWMKQGKKANIYISLSIYIAGLFLLCTYQHGLYLRYEILLSRIPIFVIGAMCGKRVYHKKEISPYGILASLLLLFSKRPFFSILKNFKFWEIYAAIIRRFYGGLLAVCAIIVLIMILKYLENTKVFDLIGFLGTFTLETYVFHIAYRKILLNLFSIESLAGIFVFLVLYTVSSFGFAYLLAKLLKGIKK